MFSDLFSENRTIYEIMSKNVIEPKGPRTTSRCTRVACSISKATFTYAHTDKYAILIALPRQQWFRERASLLRYTCIAFLVDDDYEVVN